MADATSLENDILRLDLALEPSLAVSVTDKRTGAVWSCPGPPFALHYWYASQFAVRRSPVDREKGWEFRLVAENGGLNVQCTWPRVACSFRARLRLDGAALEVTIVGRRLVENRPAEVRHMGLDLLPQFGAARSGEPGFLLIPHGLGSLCRFNKTEERETALLFYTNGDEALTAPVFGIHRAGAAFLGIVAEGEFNTELVIAANHGPEHNLNSASPRLKTRFHSGDPIEENDSRLRYEFLSGEDASWGGMARAFRKYLAGIRNYPSVRERAAQRPESAYAETATTVHLLLAEKRRTTDMAGDGPLAVKTTFDQSAQIARELHDAGLGKAALIFAGWNCEGRDGLYPTRFPIESAAGGADAMARAIAAIRALGFQPGALDNYTDSYRRSPAFNKEVTAKQLGGLPWHGGVWPGGQSYIVCPQEALERYAQRDLRRLRDLGLEGLLVLDHCPGPGVLRCYDPAHPLTRPEYAWHVRQLIQTAQATFGSCRVSGVSVFAALEADSCICPLQVPPVVGNLGDTWFADEPVPFLPIALHGLVLLVAAAEPDPLRVVEFGAAPFYELSAADYRHALPGLVRLSQRYSLELAPLASQFIESHESEGEGLIRVTYSGGAQVLINRRDHAASVGGVDVEPKGFRVTK